MSKLRAGSSAVNHWVDKAKEQNLLRQSRLSHRDLDRANAVLEAEKAAAAAAATPATSATSACLRVGSCPVEDGRWTTSGALRPACERLVDPARKLMLPER